MSCILLACKNAFEYGIYLKKIIPMLIKIEMMADTQLLVHLPDNQIVLIIKKNSRVVSWVFFYQIVNFSTYADFSVNVFNF